MPDQQYVFDFDQPPPAVSGSDLTALVGGKAAGLIAMTIELGLPVPPGFVITTSACRVVLGGGWPEELDDELQSHMPRATGSIPISWTRRSLKAA